MTALRHEVTLHGERLGDVWENRETAEAFVAGIREGSQVSGVEIVALRGKGSEFVDHRLLETVKTRGRITGEAMKRRGELFGVGPIVQAIREQGDRIVGAIQNASAEQKAHRDATAEAVVERVGALLRAALEEGTPRTVVLDPPVANDTARRPGPPTTEGLANDDEPPPRSGPRK